MILKGIKFLIVLSGMFLSMLVLANAQNDILDNAKIALKTGSSRELSKNFNSIIELSIDGEKSSYSKQHAEVLLKEFFKKHPPADFKYVHQGASKEGLNYAIGNYSYKGGVYRVYVLVKQFKGKYLIDTLEFNRE